MFHNDSLSRGRKRGSANETFTEGWREFEERLQRLRAQGRAVDFDLEETLPKALVNKYKGRERVDGCLLHYAIEKDSLQDEEQDQSPIVSSISLAPTQPFRLSNVQVVLSAGAKPNSWASYLADHEQAQFCPIHLASGLGSVESLELLVKARADINQKTFRGGSEHYCAIHEACFLKQSETVASLLTLRADANVANKLGQSPLHLVAKNGDAGIAQLLLKFKARLDQRLPGEKKFQRHGTTALFQDEDSEEEDGKTPLDVAISGDRRFPKDQLYLLAPFCTEGYDSELMTGLVRMCQKNRPAAAELIKSLCSQAAADTSRRRQLVEQFKQSTTNLIDNFAQTMTSAPEVALDILDLLTDTPEATAPEYHALPSMSNFEERTDLLLLFAPRIRLMHTVYAPDELWEFFPAESIGEKCPAWHATFAPPPRGRLSDFESNIKVVHFPNILDIRILHALNTLSRGNSKLYERAFSKDVVRAIVTCGWKFVRRTVYFSIFLDCFIVVILSNWAFTTQAEKKFSERFRTFSYIFGCCILELTVQLQTIINSTRWGFATLKGIIASHLIEGFISGSLATYIIFFQIFPEEGEINAILFCLNVLLRWFKLAHTLRLVSGLGDKILAITSSVFPMSEFFLFAGLVWCAFLAAFASIRGPNSVKDVLKSLFYTVFAGDPEAFAEMEGVSKNTNVIFGLVCLVTLIFSVAILNLMIGMYSNVYSTMEAKSTTLFLQERCGAIEHTLLMNLWPSSWGLPIEHLVTGWDGEKSSLAMILVGPFAVFFILGTIWVILLFWLQPKDDPLLLVAISFIWGVALAILKSGLVTADVFNLDLQNGRKKGQDGCFLYDSLESREINFNLDDSRSRNSQATGASDLEEHPRFLWMCLPVNPDAKKESMDLKLERFFDSLNGKFQEIDKKIEALATDVAGIKKGQGRGLALASEKTGTIRRSSVATEIKSRSPAGIRV